MQMFIFAALLTFASNVVGPASTSFSEEMRSASRVVGAVLPKAELLLVEGRIAESRQLVLNAFPDLPRSPAQELVLGNVLFRQDRVQSYELHKSAALRAPDQADALLEWGLEQHRRKEYRAALTTYRQAIEAGRVDAVIYGLAAECAIRLDDTKSAIELWQKSEASAGRLETFESIVCELNETRDPFAERAALSPKVDAGDETAAAALLLLVTQWPTDWWNTNKHPKYFDADLARIRKKFRPKPQSELAAAVCAAELASIQPLDAGGGREILKKHGFLFDPAATLPRDGKATSLIFHHAMSAAAVTSTGAREKFGDRLWVTAKQSKDPELLNLVAYLYIDTPRLAEIDRFGFENTSDPRFAASMLLGLVAEKKLKWGAPELDAARKKFPDDAVIAGIAVQLAAEQKQPLRPLLIAAIRAEFAKFSTGGPLRIDVGRPNATQLRAYFKRLAAQ